MFKGSFFLVVAFALSLFAVLLSIYTLFNTGAKREMPSVVVHKLIVTVAPSPTVTEIPTPTIFHAVVKPTVKVGTGSAK